MKLYYTEQGTGRPMVLLHGNGEDSTYFKEQIKYFSVKYKVIAIDTRGHGKSRRASEEFTLKQFAKDLKKFLDEKELKHIILLGFSDGGNIALIFTLWYPEYVDRLILNGANLNPFGMKLTALFPVLSGYAAASAAALFKHELKSKKEMLGLMVREPRIRAEKLGAIHIPTLIIVGTKDMIRRSHSKLIRRSIPGSRMREVEGGHFIAAENSGAFNQTVEHFLAAAKKQREAEDRKNRENQKNQKI